MGRGATFPWLGIWEENLSRPFLPWAGTSITRGMEFGVSPMPEPRRQMIDRGKLFGVPTYRWIPAKGKVSVEYWAMAQTAQAVPEQLARAEDVSAARRCEPRLPRRDRGSHSEPRYVPARPEKEVLQAKSAPWKTKRLRFLLMHVLVRFVAVVVLALGVSVSGLLAQTPLASSSSLAPMPWPTTWRRLRPSPGEMLKVVLKVTSNLPPEQLKHNFILLKPETDAMAFVDGRGDGQRYRLCSGREGAQRQDPGPDQDGRQRPGSVGEFKAPGKPGTYPYVCTFPGHFFAGMKGSLIVK